METNHDSHDTFAHRYEQIDAASDTSWYMTGPRPFEVTMSVGTIKPAAEKFGAEAVRRTLAGNMSHLYPKIDTMTDDERYTGALRNMMRFYDSLGLTPDDMVNTVLLNPQRDYNLPLQSLNVDTFKNQSSLIEPLIAPERADFIYTFDRARVLAVRPADCPIILTTADTPQGEILAMTHIAWGAAAHGFIDQMFATYDELGVDRDSIKTYVTPGAQAESYPYKNADDPREKYPGTDGLFTGVTETADGYSYAIDTPHFVYTELLKNGLEPEQIYVDTSDTSDIASGYSSNGRAVRSQGSETNIRDIIIAKR